MRITEKIKELDWLRQELIGRNKLISTPFGKRPLVYLDYTASGRNLLFIEDHLNNIREYYANSHTEDDFTGKTMTLLLREAESKVKDAVNAGENGKIIFTESGTTGGITRLQQILGVYVSPVAQERYHFFLESCLKRRKVYQPDCHDALLEYIEKHKPLVFVSPYEHHSNEIMWRRTLCEVIEIPLAKEGQIDLGALENIVSDPRYSDRTKIGSFSAGSNVTGILTDTYAIARILHKYDCYACFDFAACAPYIEIDMNYDEDAFYDAIFLSPHKFLGGPGASGVLIFNDRIYRQDLPPSIAAGGTVEYVSRTRELYVEDIETREKPGTPGIIQALRVALVFELKEKIGIEKIRAIESYYIKIFYQELEDEEGLIFLGEKDHHKKLGIIPFNIRYKNSDKILHPKFVTKLINDLFGIQTRAGCSCAGPYGHLIMNILPEISNKYLNVIAQKHLSGLKPGWVRLNLHYVLSLAEFEYTVDAIKFVCKNGWKFLSQYCYHSNSGEWTHISENVFQKPISLDINEAIKSIPIRKNTIADTSDIYEQNLIFAEETAKSLPDVVLVDFHPDICELIYFPVAVFDE
jgi:selenocysteine lyase/cysteine desulfurase